MLMRGSIPWSRTAEREAFPTLRPTVLGEYCIPFKNCILVHEYDHGSADGGGGFSPSVSKNYNVFICQNE